MHECLKHAQFSLLISCMLTLNILAPSLYGPRVVIVNLPDTSGCVRRWAWLEGYLCKGFAGGQL